MSLKVTLNTVTCHAHNSKVQMTLYVRYLCPETSLHTQAEQLTVNEGYEERPIDTPTSQQIINRD